MLVANTIWNLSQKQSLMDHFGRSLQKKIAEGVEEIDGLANGFQRG